MSQFLKLVTTRVLYNFQIIEHYQRKTAPYLLQYQKPATCTSNSSKIELHWLEDVKASDFENTKPLNVIIALE